MLHRFHRAAIDADAGDDLAVDKRWTSFPSASGTKKDQAEEPALLFLRTWAEAVLQQVRRVEEIDRTARTLHRMHCEVEGITSDALAHSFREQ
ncbi:hypothetical protein [Actinacidiphila oryziradicis]|uniref:Uncharacterized protein n=1 Tax=Actinacidiphila oryziradicis TaxID=2571141 RepID=A0A4U0SJZ4_9ACTN|nr:hypothetical protein [Actinacidiphila oryziradicis]TKA00605.1 hypothetical protein FCI23_42565 [Actinacidiphila oryziradicis]